ncbi:hypothetical protein [Xanthomonas sp. 60]
MISSLTRTALHALTCTMVCGCATHTTAVDAMMILPQSATTLEVDKNQLFIMAEAINTPSPAFPQVDLSSMENLTVCARFIVTEDGSVKDVERIEESPGCNRVSDDNGEPFMLEVQNALQKWTYFSAAICEFDISEDECQGQQAKIRPLAIRLAYRFDFSMKNGRRRVSVSRGE